MSSSYCIICSDLFSSTDEVYVTKCGHLFHHVCLLQWIERSKSCPQCRSKTTEKLIFRVYFNFLNNEGVSLDAGSLQMKLDNAELQLKEKKKAETAAQEELLSIKDQFSKLQEKLNSIKIKLTEKDSTVAAMKEQINYLKVEHHTVDQLKSEKEMLQQSLNSLKSLEEVLYGSASDVANLLKDTADPQSLCTYISVLKKVVVEAESKKKVLRESLRSLKNEVSNLKTQNNDMIAKTVTLEESLSHAEEEIKSLKIQIESSKNLISDDCISLDMSQSSLDSCSSSGAVKRKSDAVNDDCNESKIIKYTLEQPFSKNSSLVTSIKDATSPYLTLKQNSSALANLQLKKPVPTTYSTPKANEFSIFKSSRLTAQVVSKNNGDLFKAMLQKRKERETNYNGLGGHSKTDTFPVPLSKNAIKLANATCTAKKQTMKDKMKRLQRPPNQSTIKKAFQPDSSLDL